MKASSFLSPLLSMSLFAGFTMPMELSATPNENVIAIDSYAYLPGGAPNPLYQDYAVPHRLMDGEVGSVGSWYNGAFVLWKEESPHISFDFVEQAEVASFSIYLLNEPSAGAALPEEIRITSHSDPGLSYTFFIDRFEYPEAEAQWFSFDLPDAMITTGITLWTSPSTGWGTDWLGMSEVQFQSTAIPEPGSVALMVMGGAGAALAFWRKKGFR